jgi:dTDP-4-dehydrorhamnose reductase
MATRVVILGGSGMLGSMVADVLSRDARLQVTATARSQSLAQVCTTQLPEASWHVFDCQVERTWSVLNGADWVINAIGITKPLIHDDNPAEVERAIHVNALFPQLLGKRAEQTGTRILQIATDCVYSGARGSYVERDAHDALDVYGKTKSLGEAHYPDLHHLRCSIIGPEPKERKFLVEWFLSQGPNKELNGFINHQWNGVTTLHFARICQGVITRNLELPHLQHVVPSGSMSKADMLIELAAAYKLPDITVRRVEAGTVVDRTLQTENEGLNQVLWDAAGYQQPPTVGDMIREMARYERRIVKLD